MSRFIIILDKPNKIIMTFFLSNEFSLIISGQITKECDTLDII